jgi:beta-glucosidase
LLKPNESETVTITINPYDFASFDSQDKNKNGYKGYELEEGDYTFYGGKDAHTNFGKFTKHLDASYRFEKDPVTQTEVKPLFEHAGDHLQSLMSRTDFTGTFPKTPTEEDQAIDQAFLDELNNRDSGNDEDLSVMPTTGADVSIMFKQLVGKDYNDPLWDEFLDQLTFEEMVLLFNGGSYSTPEIERLGIPQTLDCDGPTGIVAFLGTPEVYGTCYYCSEVLLAQTYNVELADEFGKAVGNECILGDQRTDGSHLPYTGWYAPAVNLHRSPFGGRNTEYYSEDSFISGKFAARVIKEVQKKGVYTSLKHFALNDQETHRSYNGSNTWCDEQAMRELYFKPFEIAVKEGKTLGVMSSFNRIGTKWTGGDYNLLTRVLRNEWGFVGSVICDFHTDNYMNNRQMIFAGGDLNLTTTKPWNKADPTAAADVNVLRRATHNTLYAIANSNAMRLDIKGYKLPTWEIVLFVVDGALGGVLLLWGAWAIITALKKKDEVAE